VVVPEDSWHQRFGVFASAPQLVTYFWYAARSGASPVKARRRTPAHISIAAQACAAFLADQAALTCVLRPASAGFYSCLSLAAPISVYAQRNQGHCTETPPPICFIEYAVALLK
jgi:hypothetical protein